MKRFLKNVFICLIVVFAFTIFDSYEASAKSSTSGVFEVEVGSEKLPLYYVLEEDNGEVKEKIQFAVTLKGVSDVSNSYRWEHSLCYKINGSGEICEVDFTGKDQVDNPQNILSNQTYTYYFYDSDMPYYSEELTFEYVRFSNKFVNLEKNSDEEITLDDIVFYDDSNEISYYYNYDVIAGYYEENSKAYVGANNVSASFVNNSSSSLIIENAPEYKFINEVCVSENNCDVFETDLVYSNGGAFAITPYIGNISFSYNNNYFVNDEVYYDKIVFRTSMQCLKNCASRRIESEKVIVFEKEFIFDYIGPSIDGDNTIISSVDDYIKSTNVKISVKDEGVGLKENSFIYRLGWNNNGVCSFTSEVFYYENGVEFSLGSNLKDGTFCMYYSAEDKLGNRVVSDYYYFYFDNNGPTLSISNYDSYDSDDFYNKVDLKVNAVDNYSGIKKLYYLWSLDEIEEESYLDVKKEGTVFNNTGSISSLNEVNEDGVYYLYFLGFDNLDNYRFYEIGKFNLDINYLTEEEITVVASNMDEYSDSASISVTIEEMDGEESFKCGFFTSEVVNVNELNLICENGKNIVLPTNLEGKYSLWIYVHDKANNYSLLQVSENLFIDTKGPSISYNILKDDDSYHLTNEITLNVSDLGGVNETSLRYGWFIKTKTNVTRNDLLNYFENGETIGYPKNHWGEYKLYISALDNLGNEKLIGLDKIFKIDTDVIRISLIGEENITIIKGQDYVDEGAKAYKGDVSSGGRVSEVTVEGVVNNKKSGIYYITYSSGEGELKVSVTRKVVVKNDSVYLSVSGCLFVLGSLVIFLRLFLKKGSDE